MRNTFRNLPLAFLVLVLPALANEKLATGEFRPNPMAGVPAVSDCDGNGIPDIDEIVVDPTLDANFDGIYDLCQGLSVDRLSISLSEGGSQALRLNLGPNTAGTIYWVLGSTQGTSPSTEFGFTKVPLKHDGPGGYFWQSTNRPNEEELIDSFGILDANGQADDK